MLEHKGLQRSVSFHTVRYYVLKLEILNLDTGAVRVKGQSDTGLRGV